MGREWVQVRGWGTDEQTVRYGRSPGWIPRDVLEGIGVDCSPLDNRDSLSRQGTVWFTAEQAEAIRSHPEFELEVIVVDHQSRKTYR